MESLDYQSDGIIGFKLTGILDGLHNVTIRTDGVVSFVFMTPNTIS